MIIRFLWVHFVYIGTRLYLPPETLINKTYFAVPGTVWSMGVVLFRMLQGSRPFKTEEEILTGVVTFKKPITKCELILRVIPQDGLCRKLDFINMCWNKIL